MQDELCQHSTQFCRHLTYFNLQEICHHNNECMFAKSADSNKLSNLQTIPVLSIETQDDSLEMALNLAINLLTIP